MAENFPQLMINTKPQIYEAQRALCRQIPNKQTNKQKKPYTKTCYILTAEKSRTKKRLKKAEETNTLPYRDRDKISPDVSQIMQAKLKNPFHLESSEITPQK